MSDSYVTRGELIRMLQAWQVGELETQKLWDWASHRFQSGTADYDDMDDAQSVAREVLTTLDSLDLHLILPQDVPFFLEFLYTPLGAFETALQDWRTALAGLDLASRKHQLRDDPVYALYCD